MVPTGLPTEGRDQCGFALCQTDAERVELVELATEEPPGDREASRTFVRSWRASVVSQANEKLLFSDG